jgi:hypothetical protein
MALIVATLLLFAAGPFILWPLIRTPSDEGGRNQLMTSPQGGEGGAQRRMGPVPPDGAAE